jgi:hypothetical protein
MKTANEVPREICTRCGTVANPTRFIKGSDGLEIVLWLCFIVPGLIYSVWRQSSKYAGCPACGGEMISTSTPRGNQLLSQFGRNQVEYQAQGDPDSVFVQLLKAAAVCALIMIVLFGICAVILRFYQP